MTVPRFLTAVFCWLNAAVLSFSTSLVFSSEPDDNGQHDMLLMLPDGPVHLRLYLTDGENSLDRTRAMYIDKLIAALDTDKDNKLSRAETTQHPLFMTGRRFDGNNFLKRLRTQRLMTHKEIELAVNRTAGQLVTYRQNNTLADQDLSVFNVLDTDQSGLIERGEMVLAPANIAARDSDFDQCVTFDEFAVEQTDDMMNMLAIASEPPGSMHSQLLRDASEPILAARLVRTYDTDRNAHLTADETGWSIERIQAMDSNNDRKLSMQELSQLSKADPDLAVKIDLSKDSSEAMQMISEPTADLVASRADLIRLKRGTLAMTVGYRHRDPMQEAETNAAAAFNAIDVDVNGYLDREEVAEHQRFERYLFDAMDRDKDDRVFSEEMMMYVKEYTEPASTSCQVTLLDSGNGFFQVLDRNGDGRVSIRELRTCETSLMEVANNEPAINPSKLKKSYRIEIQRGGVGLFGRVDRPTAETPATLLKPPSGPIWFQRMDRNSDGDLTWDEFLGPREKFNEIDSDQDDLIDENEAKKAT